LGPAGSSQQNHIQLFRRAEATKRGFGPDTTKTVQIVGERFDCAGMRWRQDKAEAILHLRCIELNNDWLVSSSSAEATLTFGGSSPTTGSRAKKSPVARWVVAATY
jgi:hypothetical protein